MENTKRLHLKKTIFALLTVAVLCAHPATAQVTPGIPTSTGTGGAAIPTVDVLGAHNNYGRGCAGCHAPHSGAYGSGGNAAANGTVTDPYTGANALFAQDMGPLYGQSFDFTQSSLGSPGGGAINGTNASQYIFVAPSSLVGASYQGYKDIRGILMCLACHDGSIAKGAMMQNQAYEQQIGALPSSYGTGVIPTLLGMDGTAAGYHNDHPVGENATVAAALGIYYGTGSVTNGLNFTITGTAPAQAISSIAAAGEYTTFMASYGAPALMAGRTGSSGNWYYGLPVNASGVPYLLCTTCHDEHRMNIFTASTNNPIAGGSGTYATYFFIKSPYNLNNVTLGSTSVASTTQFCRQCHFATSNEANGSTYPTAF